MSPGPSTIIKQKDITFESKVATNMKSFEALELDSNCTLAVKPEQNRLIDLEESIK